MKLLVLSIMTAITLGCGDAADGGGDDDGQTADGGPTADAAPQASTYPISGENDRAPIWLGAHIICDDLGPDGDWEIAIDVTADDPQGKANVDFVQGKVRVLEFPETLVFQRRVTDWYKGLVLSPGSPLRAGWDVKCSAPLLEIEMRAVDMEGNENLATLWIPVDDRR
jgi:hypothetical protein